MTYTHINITFDDEDQRTFKRIAAALEGIESRMALIAPAKAVECGPETMEAFQKLLNDISGDIEEELKASMERACSWFRVDTRGGPENLYMTAVGDFMAVFRRALDKMEKEMEKEGEE